THRWGGWCHPLDADDFERRNWVSDSGWPFPRSQLEPYYAEARDVCGLAPVEPEGATVPRARPLPAGAEVEAISFGIAPTRFGAAYQPRLRAAANVEVVLHASALR